MMKLDSGVGLVDVLPTGTTRSAGSPLQILVLDDDLGGFWLSENRDCHCGSVDAPMALIGGDALPPMAPTLIPEGISNTLPQRPNDQKTWAVFHDLQAKDASGPPSFGRWRADPE